MGLIILLVLILMFIAAVVSGFAGIFLPILLIVALLAFGLLGKKRGVWY
jgi:hypothetical protein